MTKVDSFNIFGQHFYSTHREKMKNTTNLTDNNIYAISSNHNEIGRFPLYLPLNIVILRGLIILSLIVLIIG